MSESLGCPVEVSHASSQLQAVHDAAFSLGIVLENDQRPTLVINECRQAAVNVFLGECCFVGNLTEPYALPKVALHPEVATQGLSESQDLAIAFLRE
jgi:hypothetical protein